MPKQPTDDKSITQVIAEGAKDLRSAIRDISVSAWGILAFLMTIGIVPAPKYLSKWLGELEKGPVQQSTTQTTTQKEETYTRRSPSTRNYKPKQLPEDQPNKVSAVKDTITVSFQNAVQTYAADPRVINLIINGHKCIFRLEKQGRDTLTYVYIPDSSAVESTPSERLSDVNMVASRVYSRAVYLKIHTVHVIGPGDIYKVVAKKYGISKEVLMRLNNKTSIRADQGDQLIIPFPGEENFHLEFG